jgi:hypothetical protein
VKDNERPEMGDKSDRKRKEVRGKERKLKRGEATKGVSVPELAGATTAYVLYLYGTSALQNIPVAM